MCTRLGMLASLNSSMSSSIIDLTTPEASVPGMSQCSQPWVCEIIATEFWVPPTMKPASSTALIRGSTLALIGNQILDIRAQREVYKAVGVLIADVAQLAQGEHVEDALGTDLHGPDLVTAVGDVAQNADARMLMVLPHAEVLAHHGMQVLPRIRASSFDRLTHVCHRLSSNLRIMIRLKSLREAQRGDCSPQLSLGITCRLRPASRTTPRPPRPNRPCGRRSSGAGG